LRPVALTMALTGVLVAVVFDEDDRVSGKTVEHAAVNALAIVAAVLCVTCCIVFLYWIGCASCLRVYMTLSTYFALFVLGGDLVLAVAPVNLAFSLLLHNFAALGVAAIYAPDLFGLDSLVTRSYQIVIATLVAWHLAAYPPVTTWVSLLALATYDFFAVLAPCGPLNVLVGLMVRRRETLPGILYEVPAPRDEEQAAPAQQPASQQPPPPTDDDDGDDGEPPGQGNIKVGLGDFIFYSVLVSAAAKDSFAAAFAAMLACLVGLAATLALVAAHQSALPALPISIVLGVAATFTTDAFLLPMFRAFAERGILI